MILLSFINENSGVIALLFTGFSFLLNFRIQRAANLLTITAERRSIWSEFYAHPELGRVRMRDVDLSNKPLTAEEEHFLKSVILHLNASFGALKAGVFKKPEGLEADIASFFSLPIPNAVWEKMKGFHDRDFVRFVEKASHDTVNRSKRTNTPF